MTAGEGLVPAPAGAGPGPDLTVVVYGAPAPQGSKSPKRNRHTGRIQMVESSKKVKPWRQDVREAALAALELPGAEPVDRLQLPGTGRFRRPPLDGPLAASVVFTVRYRPDSRPVWWPAGERWSKALMWRPASPPDLSKLLRSTEDALTDAGAWRDDARVVEYRRLSKHYVGDPGPDVLPSPGAVIRVWRLTPERA